MRRNSQKLTFDYLKIWNPLYELNVRKAFATQVVKEFAVEILVRFFSAQLLNRPLSPI
jgi:hypothetical protein